MRAGFAEIEITPPLGTPIIGWIKKIVSTEVRDPLFARAAVFESKGERLAVIQADVLLFRWPHVVELRRRIEAAYGFPGEAICFSATHNHAGPALGRFGDAPCDEGYCRTFLDRIVSVFGSALEAMQDAELGIGHATEFRVGFNRRVMMRSGITKTHGRFSDPEALCFEGPVDPEVVVIAARDKQQKPLGMLVNFACHPTDFGSNGILSAGWPGELAKRMKACGYPATLFVNGAAGNICSIDPARDGYRLPVEESGGFLAESVEKAAANLAWKAEPDLAHRTQVMELPFRNPTEDEIRGTNPGAQRFVDPGNYDREMPALLERMRREKVIKAQLQVFEIDEHALIAIPAEYFAELGLRIKERTWPRRVLVLAYANGMLGYVPHREAFARGGYETTLRSSSCLAPEAGDLIADAAVDLIARAPVATKD